MKKGTASKMVRYDRQVCDHDIITAIPDIRGVVHIGLQDKLRPAVIPTNYGYAATADRLQKSPGYQNHQYVRH